MKKALYITRDGYPLHICLSDDLKTLIFASTEKAIITTDTSLKLKPYKYKTFTMLKSNTLFKIIMDKKIKIKLIDEIK